MRNLSLWSFCLSHRKKKKKILVILNNGCNFFAFEKKHKYDLRKLLCIGMKSGGVQKSSGLDLKGKGKSIFFTNLYLASFKSLGPLFLIILHWFQYNNVVRNNGILCLVMYYVQNNVFASLFFVINLLILNWIFLFFFGIFFPLYFAFQIRNFGSILAYLAYLCM